MGVMSTWMNRLFGNNVLKIEAPQDRSELKFVVLDDNGDFDSINVRFFNSNNSPIKIDFSDLSIGMLYDPDTDSMNLGEFEYVKPIENGFEVFGDFGVIWVYCDSSSPKL
jgi:hypothetical protein